jgi:F5/8 type C domain
MNKLISKIAGALLFSSVVALAQDKIPLKTELPPPLFTGTPVPFIVPNLEPKQTKWQEFLVPAGTTNLALKKKVTSSSSDSDIVTGTLDLVTDGDKAGDEGSWVELPPGKQWVQIDLAEEANIYALNVWHYHSQDRVYRDVIVQVSDDPTFAKGVTTVYDNSTSGTDHPYIETYFGKLIDAKGVKGRYVRLYSNGNTTNKMNHYIEVEVFGKPAA